MKIIVVFASGSGSNFQAIIDAVQSGKITAKIAGLITNNDNAYCATRARNINIPVALLKPKNFESTDLYEAALLKQIQAWNAELLVLAGYLLKIPTSLIAAYPNRILNIHPSLLPKYGGKGFYGLNVHKAVIAAGESESGCTVHLIEEEYDKGPILGQQKVPVYADDTPELLAERVLAEEHRLYPEIIQQYLKTLNNI